MQYEMNKLKNLLKSKKVVRILFMPVIWFRKLLTRNREKVCRNILSNLSEILINEPLVYLKEYDGLFCINPKSDIFFRLVTYKSYEPDIARICLKYLDKEKDAIDIGANMGFYTVLFAKNLGMNRKVLSVEPSKNALKYLKTNIKENGVTGKVIIFEGAISDHPGRSEIKVIRNKEEYSTLGPMIHPSVKNGMYEKEIITTAILDDLVHNFKIEPGFIKIDVEGAECLVIKGSRTVLSEFRPIIVSELSDYLLKGNRSSAREVINMIKSFDYEIYDLATGLRNPTSIKFGDIICIPKELHIRYKL